MNQLYENTCINKNIILASQWVYYYELLDLQNESAIKKVSEKFRSSGCTSIELYGTAYIGDSLCDWLSVTKPLWFGSSAPCVMYVSGKTLL